MKKILSAAIALSVLASAGAASAQSYGGYQNRDGSYQSQGGYDHDRRDERRDDRRDDRRGDRGYDHDRRDGRGYEGRDDRRESRYERRADRRYNAGRYHQPYGYQQRQWPAATAGRRSTAAGPTPWTTATTVCPRPRAATSTAGSTTTSS